MKFDQENKSFKISLFCLLGIIGLLIFFYPRLFLGLDGPLVSDHYEQHFPWFYYLAESIKNGVLPLWMPYIQSGFPIAAESQIGLFYLPNILLSLLLPIHFAYSYTLILHFFISGAFTFLFLRKSGINHFGSFIGACVFLFGTSYGGAYYNITSLKTICWLPVLLYALEGYLLKKRIRYLFLIALAVGQSLVAGYLQVATLMLFFFSIYSCFRCVSHIIHHKLRILPALFSLLPIFVSGLIGILLALPQILLTYPLAMISNRSEPAEAYAYIGSMSPFAFATLIFPHLQSLFRGNSLYGGVLLIYFLMICGFSKKEDHLKIFYRRWLWLTLIAALFALGQWSPVYIAFIKLTHFYSFRTPAKFLIFINFSIAILSAVGAHYFYRWVKENHQENLKVVSRRYNLFLVVAFVGATSAFLFVYYFGDLLQIIGHWMMEKMFYGKPGRPHELSVYYSKVDGFIIFMRDLLNPTHPYFRITVGMALVTTIATKFSKYFKSWFLIIILFLFFIDLYTFSFKDIKTDFAPYKQTLEITKIQKKLLDLKKTNQLGRLYGYRSMNDSLDMIPSINAIYHIEDVGGYSPLIMKRYHESIGLLGNVNDSNLSFFPTQEYVLERLPLLTSLGVTHILSIKPFRSDKLLLIENDEERQQWLYQIKDARSDVAFLTNQLRIFNDWESLKTVLMSERFDPMNTLLLESKKIEDFDLNFTDNKQIMGSIVTDQMGTHRDIYTVKMDQPGFFVRMISNYKGWRVLVNGQPGDILDAYGQFQGLYLAHAGDYRIEFNYTLKDALWS